MAELESLYFGPCSFQTFPNDCLFTTFRVLQVPRAYCHHPHQISSLRDRIWLEQMVRFDGGSRLSWNLESGALASWESGKFSTQA